MSKIKLLVYSLPLCIFCISLLLSGSSSEPTEDRAVEENQVCDYTFIAPTPVSEEVLIEEEVMLTSFSISEGVTPVPTATPKPTQEPISEPLYDFTEEEVDLLARLIDSEAGIESYKCKLAVGSVVVNRINSDEFPDTLEEVVYQREPCIQFSVIISKDGRRPINDAPSKESIKAAEYITMHGSTVPEDVLVFYAEYVDEGWVTRRPRYTKIDHTIFAYLD